MPPPMRVVVCEKPSVARDLARVLRASGKGKGFFEGEGLRITWCFGHMAELVAPATYDKTWRRWRTDTLPMVPETFQLQLRKGVSDHWRVLSKLVQRASELINACDAGREGELIFRYVVELAGATGTPVRRFWASSLTDTAIRQAWSRLQPGHRYDALADAARCRSEADWLVGLNATRAMTCLARSNGGQQLLSVGRVQTPTLAMIVARDREINDFEPEDFWRVKGHFAPEAGPFHAFWFRPDVRDRPARGPQRDEAPTPERLSAEQHANAVANAIQGQIGRVVEATRKRTRDRPPLLYDLTALQRRANQRYGLSAKRTLEIAQSLYEKHKLITYPRTDARFLTPDQVPGLPDVVRAVGTLPPYQACATALLQQPIRPGKRVVNAAEVGDHHAILPTDRAPTPGRLSVEEKRIYDLVARRLLAALSPDALFDVSALVVAVPPRPGVALPPEIKAPLHFRAKGRVCVERGWQAIDPPRKHTDSELPPVQEGDAAPVAGAETLKGRTRPPPRHNDASILQAMETAGRKLDDAELKRAMRSSGLGTPATRAAILQTLLQRGYIDRQGKALVATDRGCALIDAVPVDELKSAQLTGRWEARLAKVAEGDESRAAFMEAVVKTLHQTIPAILQATPPPPEEGLREAAAPLGDCPLCGKPVREKKTVYACDSGRSCPLVIGKRVAKRAISKRSVQQLLTQGRTPVLKRFRSKKGKLFEAALVLEEGRVTFSFPDRQAGGRRSPAKAAPAASPAPARVREGDACPTCGQGTIIRGRAALGCSRWREGCGFRAPLVG